MDLGELFWLLFLIFCLVVGTIQGIQDRKMKDAQRDFWLKGKDPRRRG